MKKKLYGEGQFLDHDGESQTSLFVVVKRVLKRAWYSAIQDGRFGASTTVS